VQWRTRPLFVSSTFNDFQAERDLLQNLVFPELAERLLERRHNLEPIDLRLGVETASEADEVRKTLLVLTVCLHEVARSRPFFIALIGDRYGWVPSPERARRAAEEAGFESDVSGKSVTEVEIEFGVLQSEPEQPIRAFAYFRDLDLASMPEHLRTRYRDADTTRIKFLKRRLSLVLGRERCRTYRAAWDASRGCVAGLDEFRKMIIEDLWSDLDSETRRYQVVVESWQDRERAALSAFVHDTARDFTGREAILVGLSSLARSQMPDHTGFSDQAPRWGACVTGVSGSGKSSLAAELIRRLRADSSILLLEHAAGISGESTRIDRLLQRWSDELAERLGDTDRPSGALTGEELERGFARLLTRASQQQRTVIVIDALNEFERTTQARHLTWLPRIWPPNARFIATATLGTETQAIERRLGFGLLELEPLTGTDADRIADAVYRRYRRQANPQVKRAILDKRTEDGSPASGNPLWLELACEEMNLLDPEDLARAAQFEGAPDQQLILMQLDIAGHLPPTARAMYGRMLKRAGTVAATILREEHPDIRELAAHEWVHCLAETIAISRNGWRERDLQTVVSEITGIPWSELLFSSVRRALRGHLIQRGPSGQWDFYHRQLREAANYYFASPPAYLRQLHASLAAYLETLPEDNPLRQTERMHHLIGADDKHGAARLYALCEHGSSELRAATESLADLFRARKDAAEWVGSLLAEPVLSPPEHLLLGEKIMYPLHDALANEGRVQERRALVNLVRNQTARLAEQATPGLDHDFALRQHSVSLVRLADLAMDVGTPSEARALYEEHLRYAEQLAGPAPKPLSAQQDLSVALERLGDLAEREGNVEKAREYFQKQLNICQQLIAARSEDRQSQGYLSSVLERLGNLALAEGDRDEAERYLRQASQARERLALLTGEGTSAASLNILARLAEATDQMKEARALYRQYEEILHRRAEASPEDVDAQIVWSISLERLGDVALFQRDTDDAIRYYGEALEIRQRLAVLLPEDVATQRTWSNALEKVADVALQNDQFAKARPCYEKSLAIRERLHAMLPDDVQARRDLGLAHERLGMLQDEPAEKRLPHLQQAVEIYAELYERLPASEEAGRTLALGHFALAQALAGIPDQKEEAFEHTARSHELLSELRARGRQLDPTAKRLLAFLDTQFGGSGRWTHPVAAANEEAYGELNALGRIGVQALAAGDYKTAEKNFRQSLELARRVNHPPSIVRACGSLGQLKAKTGKTREALKLLNEAIAIARENDLPVEEGQTLERIADLYAELGDRNKALELYKERVALAHRSGHQHGVALGSANAGVMHFEKGEFPEAVEYLQTAAELFESYRMWPQLAHAYSYLGYAYQALRDFERSIQAYSKHVSLCKRTGDVASAAGSMANLSGVLFAIGRRDDAVDLGAEACDYLEQMGSPEAPAMRARVESWKQT
jgi:tetratricopeptide (TPR) repeat protein